MIKEYSIPSSCNTTFMPDLPRFPVFQPSEPLHDGSSKLVEFPDASNADHTEVITQPDTAELQTETKHVPATTDYNSEEISDVLNDSLYPLETLETTNKVDAKEDADFSQLSVFVDVSDHDLDFPDSLEENMPVSVLPPPGEKSLNITF